MKKSKPHLIVINYLYVNCKKPSGSNNSPSSYIEELSSSTNTPATKPINFEVANTPTVAINTPTSKVDANYASSSTSTALAKPVPLSSDVSHSKSNLMPFSM
ncbi:18548_t:CDS:2, partial [Dentiscutata erythropus]